jgi:hypothetical protein
VAQKCHGQNNDNIREEKFSGPEKNIRVNQIYYTPIDLNAILNKNTSENYSYEH